MSSHPDSAPATVGSKAGDTPSAPRGNAGRWITLGLVVLTALAACAAWALFTPPARLDEPGFLQMAKAGRFDQAEALLRSHLRQSPNDERAHFLLAQLLVERPDRQDAGARADDGAEALEHLDRLPENIQTKPPDSPAVRQHYRGKAYFAQKKWDRAEEAWLEALRLDPTVPEAGFALLDLYYLQFRRREGRELALRLVETEPDPGDRIKLLTALLFQDAIKPDASSLLPVLEGVSFAEPGALKSQVALGRALVRASQPDRGIPILRKAVDAVPVDTADSNSRRFALEGLLTGLDEASRADEVVTLTDSLPKEFRSEPWFARFLGLSEQQNGNWPAAITAYRRAAAVDPSDFESRSRLAQALRISGQKDESDTLAEALARERETLKGLVPLHDELTALASAAGPETAALLGRAAEAYESIGRTAEAAAWRRAEHDAATAR